MMDRNKNSNDRPYMNYKDEDIPKRLKLTFVEELQVIITYPSQRLNPFLPKKHIRVQPNHNLIENMHLILSPNTTFEMTITPNKTYYL